MSWPRTAERQPCVKCVGRGGGGGGWEGGSGSRLAVAGDTSWYVRRCSANHRRSLQVTCTSCESTVRHTTADCRDSFSPPADCTHRQSPLHVE